MTSLLESAKAWAIEAGLLLMQEYKSAVAPPTIVSDPSVKSFSTTLDIEIQRKIHQHIQEAFPDHAFLGEEEGQQEPAKTDGYTWVVDPIDGTLNFYFHVPLFVVAIGILKNRLPHIGVIYDPVHRELYAAERGQGPALVKNLDTGVEQPLMTAKADRLGDAIVMTHLTTNNAFREKFIQDGSLSRLASAARHIRMLGCGQLALAYVARGRFHAFVVNHTNPWDLAAGHAIVEAAGGVVTDIAGQPWIPEAQSTIAACNASIHNDLLHILQQPQTPG